MRKLYLEKDLSSYEIHNKTKWSRTSISDALRTLGIEKVKRKAPVLSYGEKLIGTKRVVHKGEQKLSIRCWPWQMKARASLKYQNI